MTKFLKLLMLSNLTISILPISNICLSSNVIKLIQNETTTDLNTIITNKNIGNIYVGQDNVPTKTEILNAIKANNPSAQILTLTDFDFQDLPTATTTTIIGKGNYTGKITLTYEISNFTPILNTNEFISSLLIASDRTIYAWSDHYFYKSTDGNSFTAIPWTIGGELNFLVVAPNGTIYVMADFIFKSTDGGNSFTAMTGASDHTIKLVIAPNGTIYAIAMYDNAYTIYKCTDGNTFIPMTGISRVTNLIVLSNGIIYAATDFYGVYKSIDGCNTFMQMPGTSGIIYDLEVAPNETVYAANENTNCTVYKSTDGNTFSAMTGTTGGLRNLAVALDGTVYLAASDIIYKCLNNQTNFTAMTVIPGNIEALAVALDGTIYVGNDIATVYRSIDGGNTFTAMTGIGLNVAIDTIVVDLNGTVYASGDCSIYKSEKIK